MSQNRRNLIQRVVIVCAVPVAILVVIGLSVVIHNFAAKYIGHVGAFAVEDKTGEIMAASIVDAKELWISAMAVNKIDDGDDIAIAIITSKLFEMRYLQTYIE